MNLILFCILVYLSALNLVNSMKYEYINDCIFKENGRSTPGLDEITFICSEKDREDSVFLKSVMTSCSNTLVDAIYKWHGTVDFKNCRFPQIKRNYFEMFKNMHTFNISNVELETMQLEIFREASNVTTLDLSKNKLAEIPSHIFFNGKKLKFVDLSENVIERIDRMAFEGATNLETLNLSHNNISELQDSRTLSLSKLLKLDLSHNNFIELTEHIFDKLKSLELLNLSFNAIGNLDIKTFSYLVNLKDLNLKQTNLSNIQLGTFSQQRKLVSLDLSENYLKKLEIKLFLPLLPDLRTLNLAYNQLENLNGFRNAIFPQLSSLQIQGNQLSCAYLAHFMELINWEKIHLSVDVNSTVLQKSNIRGIGCNEEEEKKTLIDGMDETAQIDHGYKVISIHDDTNDAITFICVVLTIFLILFTIANSNQIFKQFKKTFKFCQRIKTYSLYSSNGNVVEFTNEQITIK